LKEAFLHDPVTRHGQWTLQTDTIGIRRYPMMPHRVTSHKYTQLGHTHTPFQTHTNY